ncbi:MAG: polyprenyl synthetase family protein [Oscillospiraceae bacterium]|nr:polyprenyl synthetase family protein [Oscillospiraceae bacterium]
MDPWNDVCRDTACRVQAEASSASAYPAQFSAEAERISLALPAFLPVDAGAVGDAAAYSLQNGGKRIRPVLLLAWCRLCGGAPEAALPFAAALEMIHTYSLIHDDLPCMDDDDLRRGKPSCHKAFGEATALLAGDALLTQAFALVAGAESQPPAVRCAAAALLARAAGAQGMIGGQMLDLAFEGRTVERAQLEEMNRKKTGALLEAACLLGCLAAGADAAQEAAAGRYADAIGLLFQLTDDILDVAGETAALGKPVGSDAANGKSTWVTLLGLEGARQLAKTLHAQATEALAGFGADADFLRWLAGYILARES